MVEIINPTCNDGIKNQDEQGIDCGGSCSPCVELQVNKKIIGDQYNANVAKTSFGYVSSSQYSINLAGFFDCNRYLLLYLRVRLSTCRIHISGTSLANKSQV